MHPADVTSDGLVDVRDLITVIVNYGRVCAAGQSDCPGDANGDGFIDVGDLSLVFEYWD